MTAIQRGQKDIMCFIDELTPQEVFSAIVLKETVCTGYSKAFSYYCHQLGITATSLFSCFHAWNLVELEGEFYNLDATWADREGGETDWDWYLFSDKFTEEYDGYGELVEAHRRNAKSRLLPACVGGKYAKKIVISKELQEEEKETYEPEIPTEEETTRKNEFEVVLDEFLLNGSDLLEKVPHRIAGKADTLYVDVKIFTEECHPYDANCRMFTYEYDETLKEIYLFSYATEVLMVKLTLESKRFEQLYDSYHYLFAQGTMQCDAPFVEDGVVWIPFLLIADMYDMEINVVYQGDSLLKEDIADYDKDSYVMGE